MSIIDNMVVIRLLMGLTTPVEKTKAFKTGLIDKDMNVLVSYNDRTPDQRNAYTYLDRFTFNLKRMLWKIPGGKLQIATIAAAMMLVKDSDAIKSKDVPNVVREVANHILVGNLSLIEEESMISDYLLFEDGELAVNHTGDAVSTNVATKPMGKMIRRKFGEFDVDDDTMAKFKKGKKKFDRWDKYLNMEDEKHQEIHSFAKKNPKGIIVLKNGDNIKAIRFNRNGGGAWHKHKRGNKNGQTTN